MKRVMISVRMSCVKPVSFWVKSALEVPLLTCLGVQVGRDGWRTLTDSPPTLGPFL